MTTKVFFSLSFFFFDGGAHTNSHTQNGGESKRERTREKQRGKSDTDVWGEKEDRDKWGDKEERVIQIYGPDIWGES